MKRSLCFASKFANNVRLCHWAWLVEGKSRGRGHQATKEVRKKPHEFKNARLAVKGRMKGRTADNSLRICAAAAPTRPLQNFT